MALAALELMNETNCFYYTDYGEETQPIYVVKISRAT